MFTIRHLIQKNTIPYEAYVNVDIFVYCGGKCGSSTLEATFIKHGFKTIRVHGINDWVERYPKGPGIMSIIKENSKRRKIYIIDAYRTPIERQISAFFQNIERYVPTYEQLSITGLINIFDRQFLSKIEGFHSIDEVMREYNVPLFTEFDFNRGYVMKEHNNVVFVKLLFRDIAKWGPILSEIFGRNITIQANNITFTKDINTRYNAFKAAYRVPASYLPTLQDDKHFQTFNTPDQQKEYIANWKLKTKEL